MSAAACAAAGGISGLRCVDRAGTSVEELGRAVTRAQAEGERQREHDAGEQDQERLLDQAAADVRWSIASSRTNVMMPYWTMRPSSSASLMPAPRQ